MIPIFITDGSICLAEELRRFAGSKETAALGVQCRGNVDEYVACELWYCFDERLVFDNLLFALGIIGALVSQDVVDVLAAAFEEVFT